MDGKTPPGRTSPPISYARKSADGFWYVAVTWSNGRRERLGPYKTEAVAQEFIKAQLDAWHEGQKLFGNKMRSKKVAPRIWWGRRLLGATPAGRYACTSAAGLTLVMWVFVPIRACELLPKACQSAPSTPQPQPWHVRTSLWQKFARRIRKVSRRSPSTDATH